MYNEHRQIYANPLRSYKSYDFTLPNPYDGKVCGPVADLAADVKKKCKTQKSTLCDHGIRFQTRYVDILHEISNP